MLLTTPMAVELSDYNGDGSCGHPISTNICCISTIVFAVTNSAESSASAADDMTNIINVASFRIGPLKRVMGLY